MSRCRMTCYIVVAMIILQAILLVITNFGSRDSEPVSIEKPSKVHLLIISTWRSGSSLVGQFFNQHPDVFYLKEPAWHAWQSLSHNNPQVLQMTVRDLIQSTFKCDMSELKAYLPVSVVSDLFHWSSSRALCSPPACNAFLGDSNVKETHECIKHCGKSAFATVQESCNTYSHVVLQEYRFSDLEMLYPLIEDPTINLKILHVVRDPRAVAKSREQVKLHLNFDDSAILDGMRGIQDFNLAEENRGVSDADRLKVLKKICQSQVYMYRTSNVNPPPFLKDRYMLLRYDDLVRDPLNVVKEMYAFADLNLTDDLKKWIYEMTHGEGLQQSKPFTVTSRDALHVAREWRNVLTFEEVEQVQQICKDFMDFFRYRTLDSEDELKNFDLDTLLPRDKNDFK